MSSLLQLSIRPCIHRMLPCGMCRCSLVTCHTENEPLFCLVIWIRPLSKTKGSFFVWRITREQGHTRQGNILWIQGLILVVHIIEPQGCTIAAPCSHWTLVSFVNSGIQLEILFFVFTFHTPFLCVLGFHILLPKSAKMTCVEPTILGIFTNLYTVFSSSKCSSRINALPDFFLHKLMSSPIKP